MNDVTRSRIEKSGWELGALVAVASAACVWSIPAFAGTLDPVSVRSAANAAGLRSLGTVPTPRVSNLGNFLNPGAGAATAAVKLGKALFWDMQTGSDGQACASCHFHAGADSRSRNQLSPGLRNVDPAFQNIFNATATGGGGPDFTLTAADFPFHQLADPANANFSTRTVTFDTDDVASSMGAFAATFTGLAAPLLDAGTPFVDPVFNIDTPAATTVDHNVRRVEPRNTPTVINAVFNHANFWDGRAHNLFNGVSPIGPLDTGAMIWVNNGPANTTPAQQQVRIPNSSLASQAVGPPTSDLEMSFFARNFPFVGRKLLGRTPLGQQQVSPTDSVLGPISRFPVNGINASYAALIRLAFQPKYWNGGSVTLGAEVFSQMEANFTLFFGLAVQLYETKLVSDRTPFDYFMAGDDLALLQPQLQGLLVFLNRGEEDNPPPVNNAIAAATAAGVPIGVGNCVSCHSGPVFTADSFTSLGNSLGMGPLELIEIEQDVPVLVGGFLQQTAGTAVEDGGFANIGVRLTGDDLGRGGKENGYPLSFVRQALDPNLNFLLPPGVDLPALPPGTKVQVDGAFKIPGLRNAELTGPYFHNGGQSTLTQVVSFYRRQSDFADVNIENLDGEIAAISLAAADEPALVSFLMALTDERVRQEQAPFDHPQILVPDGGTFASPQARVVVPAVGAGGRPAAGLPPLDTFLGLAP